MGMTKDEINKKFEIEKNLQLLQSMQDTVKYSITPLDKPSLLRIAANRIPWLSKFLQAVDDTGDSVVKIGERVANLPDIPGKESLSQGFSFGGIAMAAFDFLRVPIIYLSAYLLGQEVPVNLNNNARWLYSALLLALTITAIAAPVTAPYIAFIAAGISLTVGVFLLGKTLYERYRLGKERKKIETEIRSEEEEMHTIQKEVKRLKSLLEKATEEEQIAKILFEIAVIQEQYNAQKKQIQDLKNKEFQLEQQIKEIGVMQVVDRSIAIGLAALTIISLVVSLFFPPVGLWMLTGIAIFGGAYLAARLATPFIKSLGSWIYNKLNPSTEENPQSEEIINAPSLSNQHEKQKDASAQVSSDLVSHKNVAEPIDVDSSASHTDEHVHESTQDVLTGLSGSVDTLKKDEEEIIPSSNVNYTSPLVFSLTPKPHSKQLSKKESDEKGERESNDKYPEPH